MQVKMKNLIVGALLAGLVALMWFQFVYSPMESKASKARSAAHDADTTAAQLRQSMDTASAAKKKAKLHDPAISAMVAALPANSAEASFLRSVDTLRVTSGATWQSITPTAPTPSGSVVTINVGIAVQGTQPQLLAYAKGLEGLKRLFVIDNISIAGGGSKDPAGAGAGGAAAGGGAGDQFQMQVSGRIFSQPTAVASTTTPAAAAAAGTTPATVAPATNSGTAPSGVQNN